jgi:16S rRNA (guanine527-N7)-methyltransferase
VPSRLYKKLQQGLAALDIELAAATSEKLLAFLELLARWNRAYNLTAVREIEQMLPRHVLDSLSVLPYLHGSRVLDIGTGAGLPGIPLALARPDVSFVLLDSNAKKIRFVKQAVHELGLRHVEVVHAAVERYQPAERFDSLIARAVAAIPDMLESCRHLCAPGSRVLAMKGVFPQDELAALDRAFRVREVAALAVPGLDAARHVVVIEPTAETGQRT